MNYAIGKVAVIGAGTMGASIAAFITGAGIPVCLLDIVPKEMTPAEKKKGVDTSSAAFRNRFAIAGKERVCKGKNAVIHSRGLASYIQVGNLEDDLDLLKDCDWVIEAVVEDLQIKKDLFYKIEPYVNHSAIISTNTSGLEIGQISKVLPQTLRGRFMGTHFFNPPRFLKLFELIPGPDTEEKYLELMRHFATFRLGKGVVVAKDTPNFIANRIGTQASVTTMQITEKYGYTLVKADQLTGEAMGRPRSATFRTTDMVGLDIFAHVAENMRNHSESPDEIHQNTPPDYVRQLLENGALGDKTGAGFYKKETPDKRSYWDYKTKTYLPFTREELPVVKAAMEGRTPAERLSRLVWGAEEENHFAWDVLKASLLYAAEHMQEIAGGYEDIDNAMRWGYNWTMGPFEMWDAIGFRPSVERMKKEGEEIPSWIQKRLNEGKDTFCDKQKKELPYIVLSSPQCAVISENHDAVLKNIGDDVACLEFRSKGNSITDEVAALMEEAIRTVEEGDYKGLVIGHHGNNFSVGANLVQVGQMAREKNWDYLENMVRLFQQVNQKMKYSKKPIAAAPHGRTLGGGAEITMHTSCQVPYAETYMGLVEVGVGLVPGGGGTKELLERLMKRSDGSLPSLINQTRNAWETISMGKVSTSGHDAIALGFIDANTPIEMNLDYQLNHAKDFVIQAYERGYRPAVKKDVPVTGLTGRAAIDNVLDMMLQGNFISKYDAFLAEKVLHILTGGNVLQLTMVSEEYLLNLEVEAFLSLCGEAKTQARIEHMLKKGKPLRN